MTNQSNDVSNGARLLLPELLIEKDSFRILLIAIVTLLLAVLFFLEIVVWYTDVSLVVLFMTGLPVLMVTVGFLLIGIKHIVQGHYKSALLMILAIPFLIFAFSLPSRLFAYDLDYYGFTRVIAYHIKFTLHEKQYLEAIKLIQPDEKGFRYKEFIWTSRFGGEGTRLLYDESDELELPKVSRSIAWWVKVSGKEGYFSCISQVYRIKSHFYIVRLDCG